jgi:pimeloyl-ACP methyl ester carboxylesterase
MYENLIKIALVIFGILLICVLIIKRFVYFKPSSEFLPYSETYQDISEGNLHGWFIGEKGNKTILICHGNSGNISHRQSIIDPLVELGYSVLIFDYSGYGRSRGIPSESQFYQDASVFTNILLEFTNIDNIVIYGESIGAPVAAYIARKYGIKTLIIDSGLPSIKKFINYQYGILGKIIGFIFPEFNTEAFLNGYNGNVLVMHSPTDETIPYTITDKIRENAKEIINIQGTHNQRMIPWNKVNTFIKHETKSLIYQT